MLTIPKKVRDIIKSDSYDNNIRIRFPNGERADITNENIVSESVDFRESICSRNGLKFGLCETPMIQFETFGVENVKGATIECSLEVDCHLTGNGTVTYDVPSFVETDNENVKITNIEQNVFRVERCRNGYSALLINRALDSQGHLYLLTLSCVNSEDIYPNHIADRLYVRSASNSAIISEVINQNEIKYLYPSTDGTMSDLTVFFIDSSILYYDVKVTVEEVSYDNVSAGMDLPGYDGDYIINDRAEFTVIDSNTLKVEPYESNYSSGKYTLLQNETLPKGVYQYNKNAHVTHELQIIDRYGNFIVNLNDNIPNGSYIWLEGTERITHKLSVGLNGPEDYLHLDDYFKYYGSKIIPVIEGAVYRSDIDKWVYPIPYGKFVVDSCKKQSDMTHRRFICYNEIAYQNWEFPALAKSAIESILWKDKSLTLSIESIIGMLLPEYGRSYSRANGGGCDDFPLWNASFTHDGVDYRLDTYVNMYNIPFQLSSDPAFSVVKEHYSTEYIKKVSEIKEKLLEFGFFNDGVFSVDDGINSFSKQQVAINTSSSAFRYYHMSVGMSLDATPKGVSKIYNPTNDALVVPYVYMNTGDSSSYPYWQISNGGYFEGLGTMQSVVFNFYPPSWARCVGLELVDVTHDEVIASAKLSADDDYIDYEIDCIKFLEGDSGIKFKPKFSSKKITMTTKNGTAKQTVYRASLNFLNQKWQDFVDAYAEIQGKFGKFDRYGDINFISLKDNLTAIYPSETLYPSSSLYPTPNVGIATDAAYYRTLWYDDDYTLPIGRITVTYNDSVEGDDYQVDVYCNGFTENSSPTKYMVYDLTDNVLIKSRTWTEEEITNILNTIATNVTGVVYMPCELTMKGRPDLESGDILEIRTSTDNILTYVLNRTISGIQNLVDDVEST